MFRNTKIRIEAIKLLSSIINLDDLSEVQKSIDIHDQVLKKNKQKFLIKSKLLVQKSFEYRKIAQEKFESLLQREYDWNNISDLVKAILVSAFCEFVFLKSTPRNVVIDEYTKISKLFFENKEVDFINALLDRAFIH